MYIIIVGCGRMGSTIAKALANDDNDVVVIDHDEKNLNNLGVVFNGQRIKGNEIDKDVLIEAGINQADVFLALTPNDNINILSAKIAKDIFKVKRVIGRVNDIEKQSIYRQLEIECISLISLGANMLRERLREDVSEDLAIVNEEIVITKVTIKRHQLIAVKDIEKKYNCRICSIINSNSLICGDEDYVEYDNKIICAIDLKNKIRLVEDLCK